MHFNQYFLRSYPDDKSDMLYCLMVRTKKVFFLILVAVLPAFFSQHYARASLGEYADPFDAEPFDDASLFDLSDGDVEPARVKRRAGAGRGGGGRGSWGRSSSRSSKWRSRSGKTTRIGARKPSIKHPKISKPKQVVNLRQQKIKRRKSVYSTKVFKHAKSVKPFSRTKNALYFLAFSGLAVRVFRGDNNHWWLQPYDDDDTSLSFIAQNAQAGSQSGRLENLINFGSKVKTFLLNIKSNEHGVVVKFIPDEHDPSKINVSYFSEYSQNDLMGEGRPFNVTELATLDVAAKYFIDIDIEPFHDSTTTVESLTTNNAVTMNPSVRVEEEQSLSDIPNDAALSAGSYVANGNFSTAATLSPVSETYSDTTMFASTTIDPEVFERHQFKIKNHEGEIIASIPLNFLVTDIRYTYNGSPLVAFESNGKKITLLNSLTEYKLDHSVVESCQCPTSAGSDNKSTLINLAVMLLMALCLSS